MPEQELEEMTLKQIFQSIGKLKYKTIAFVVTAFIAVVSASFAIGRYTYQRDTAVRLESPFAMRITLNDKDHDFSALTLIKDPLLASESKDVVRLSLREIQSPFDVVQVGIVVAQVEKSELGKVWSIFSINIVPSISKNAYAQPAEFNWYGHQTDYNFTEQHIDEDTVHRTYSDGCILEYKMNQSRRSVPSSFKWIKVNH
jgi:hypothetical protein